MTQHTWPLHFVGGPWHDRKVMHDCDPDDGYRVVSQHLDWKAKPMPLPKLRQHVYVPSGTRDGYILMVPQETLERMTRRPPPVGVN
jgi:hypothetical protein